MDTPLYLLLPWRMACQGDLSDAEYRTYLLILSLAWGHDRHQTPPIGRRELAAMRGVALRTVDAHLRSLRLKGYVCNAPGREGLKLILIPTALEALAEAQPTSAPPSAPLAPTPAAFCGPSGGPSSTERVGSPREERPSASTYQGPPPASPGEGDKQNKLDTAKGQEELLAISKRLKGAGVYPVLAERLAREPWVSLELVEAWIAALRRRPHVRQLGGLLAAILRQPETCLPAPCLAEVGSERTPGEGASLKPVPSPTDDSFDNQPLSPEGEEGDGGQLLWEQVLALLRQRLGEERVRVWLGGSVPLSMAEGRLLVALRSPLGVDWVQKRYWQPIQEAVEEVAGRSLELRFVVGGKGMRSNEMD